MTALARLALLLACLPLACQKSSAPAPAASAAASEALPSAAPPPEPLAAPPPDFDVAGLEKPLGCAGKGGKEACRVLAEFASGERWEPRMPAGEGRWIGHGYVIEKASEKRQLLVLWAKRLPTAQVGRGDLPLRVGTGVLPEELTEHGQKLISALAGGDTVSRKNRAQPFVEGFVPNNERGVGPTAGASVRLISEETVYLRQKGRKLLMLHLNREPAAEMGDGTYAEFWSVSW